MKRYLLLVISLSIFSFAELVPLNKPSSRKNAINVPDEQNAKEIHPQVRNSVQSIADFTVTVNGTELILQKDTPTETIIISTKIPSISQKFPIDPENEICDKEGSFDVELKRGNDSLFKFLCLTPSFFNESAAFAVNRLRPDQPLTRTSINSLLNIFSKPSPLTDDRIRKILKDKKINQDLIEIMQSEAKKYY